MAGWRTPAICSLSSASRCSSPPPFYTCPTQAGPRGLNLSHKEHDTKLRTWPRVEGEEEAVEDEENKRGGAPKSKNVSPNAPSQTIIFDVSQHLDEVQAPQDVVKSTAIALVKVDSTFLPGTTIGATRPVAYAMTKGRVCVISRPSSDRTLLTLPPLFPPATAVSDMLVNSNCLAGVRVWHRPDPVQVFCGASCSSC
ncbi:hypothetical protein LXA43DRAFT_1066183 [Ganoderma leucocontextum]|nr:hypothetical protein LXA43DRAFT_1066183 [Ganoderma leucocontextum]